MAGGKAGIRTFFDGATNTATHLVWDPASRRAVLIDPVLDFELADGSVTDRSAQQYWAAIEELGLALDWVLETHVHADHLSSAQLMKVRTGAKVAIGQGVTEVQKCFAPMFGGSSVDGDAFDRLLADGDRIALGELEIQVIATPGHTPADISFRIGDALFVGDTLFMPDFGTARTDFPGGDAGQLFRSIRKILASDPDTRIFHCHDYKAPGRDHFAWESSIGDQRRSNKHVHDGVTEAEFVAMREERDRALPVPRLLLPSIQVNIRAEQLPVAGSDGQPCLQIPLTVDFHKS